MNRNFPTERDRLRRVCEGSDWDFTSGEYETGEQFAVCHKEMEGGEEAFVKVDEKGEVEMKHGNGQVSSEFEYQGEPEQLQIDHREGLYIGVRDDASYFGFELEEEAAPRPVDQ